MLSYIWFWLTMLWSLQHGQYKDCFSDDTASYSLIKKTNLLNQTKSMPKNQRKPCSIFQWLLYYQHHRKWQVDRQITGFQHWLNHNSHITVKITNKRKKKKRKQQKRRTEEEEATEQEEGKKDDVFTKMLSCPCCLIVSSSTRLVSSSLLKSPTSSKGWNKKRKPASACHRLCHRTSFKIIMIIIVGS